MCGIVGYTGFRHARDVVLDGLCALEYRGYDSAGIALNGDGLEIRKCAGRVKALREVTPPSNATCGIGHTRWATHGAPVAKNAHPHMSFDGDIAVVHNGVIENHEFLRAELARRGIRTVSDTDSELIAHMLALETGNMEERVRKVAAATEGAATFLAVKKGDCRIYCHRRGAALLLAHAEGESFASSDMLALSPYVNEVTVLRDGESGVLSADGIKLFDRTGKEFLRAPCPVTSYRPKDSDCHMREEIAEIPRALSATYASVSEAFRTNKLVLTRLKLAREILLIGCGTAYHACLYGKEIMEEYLNIPCRAVPASEAENLRFVDESVFAVFVTQSGETADTLRALDYCRGAGAATLALTNVKGSTVTFKADCTLYLDAGPEVAVAATKSYCCQLLALAVTAKTAAGVGTDEEEIGELAKTAALVAAPPDFADCVTADRLFFIGKGIDGITAQEGALKFREITYKTADAYLAGELKHGTIALIDCNSVAVVCATVHSDAKRIRATVSELKSRGATVYAVSAAGDVGADKTLTLPPTEHCEYYPLLAVIPLQLLALESSLALGLDPDKPRNLAKSVTVI